jgi:hypothetical protein
LDGFGSSFRREDLENDPLAIQAKPSNHDWLELQLHQYKDTDVVQWHGKVQIWWFPVGPALRIRHR